MNCSILFIIELILVSSAYQFDPPRTIDLFDDLISRVSTTTESSKCNCPSEQQKCTKYDSRIQAASLEEAIVAFPDLTITQQEEKSVAPSTLVSSLTNCNSRQCRDCYKDLRMQLRKVGLLQSTINQVFRQQHNFTTCGKYRFTRNDAGVYQKEKNKKKKKKNESGDGDLIELSALEEWFYGKRLTDVKKIEKRQTTTVYDNVSAPGIIGVRFPISCTTRGITADGLNTVSLCSACWVWRRLPSTYFPAYLNEVVCDNVDTTCLSGYANCHTGMQQYNVLRNDSGQWVPVTVSAGINCECRPKVGSVVESLVLGKGTARALDPVDQTVN
ncbi:unnamed protein product [Caenorhabditis bovis]|uniref:Uncharacterized protein n=1 Tax=Caenorhabditis bovis TaxID=2654633 RepID=A0A8S1EF98_9PELO|nr:unnamed protein product [Caenorhabditis bovis]